MAKADEFNLPASSWAELKKIIQGYARLEKDVEREKLSKLLSIHKNTISGNNKFLAKVGIIQGGVKKSTTPLGSQLGRAIEHGRREPLVDAIRSLVSGSEFLSDLITTVRIKGGMSRDDLQSHILYASGAKSTHGNKTGASTVVEILEEAGLLVDDDGTLKVSQEKPSADGRGTDRSKPGESEDDLERDQDRRSRDPRQPSLPAIAINIQLQVPETDNPTVYENFFKALRLHLLEPRSGSEGAD